MMGAVGGERHGLLADYDPGAFYCEMLRQSDAGQADIGKLLQRIDRLKPRSLQRRARNIERELFNLGITFTIYSQKDSIDRILPFDVIPRVIAPKEWAVLEAGLKQRLTAMNLFLHDIYHEQKILNDGVIPRELVLGNANYRPEMQGVDLRHGTYIHICGVDIIRDQEGQFRVLEDNGRTPSGVSYVVENRHLMSRAFPDLIEGIGIRPVSNYGQQLRDAMAEIAPSGIDDPQIVLLSPGVYNSAYFEHVFLAREMGVPLVEGSDLIVDDDLVMMKTTAGRKRVDVIYRRINDDFLDPEVFEPTSLLGVPGLMRVYRKGRVALANAVGTGVADDKAIYAYMPRIVRYYLDQDPIIPNVETRICREPDALGYTLDHLADLVVKPVGESGGYGITVGPKASAEELEACRKQLLSDPDNYISQPTIGLSVCPTLVKAGLRPRHVDLRPFLITGADTWVLPGGLTRVALRKGSLIVNSSQGGGTKDTWVLD